MLLLGLWSKLLVLFLSSLIGTRGSKHRLPLFLVWWTKRIHFIKGCQITQFMLLPCSPLHAGYIVLWCHFSSVDVTSLKYTWRAGCIRAYPSGETCGKWSFLMAWWVYRTTTQPFVMTCNHCWARSHEVICSWHDHHKDDGWVWKECQQLTS